VSGRRFGENPGFSPETRARLYRSHIGWLEARYPGYRFHVVEDHGDDLADLQAPGDGAPTDHETATER
jgi:hypothetical protein